MQPENIFVGRSYLNETAKLERKVLRIGLDVPVTPPGNGALKPDEPGVEYVTTRNGSVFHGDKGWKGKETTYLYSFAKWSQRLLPKGQEAVG